MTTATRILGNCTERIENATTAVSRTVRDMYGYSRPWGGFASKLESRWNGWLHETWGKPFRVQYVGDWCNWRDFEVSDDAGLVFSIEVKPLADWALQAALARLPGGCRTREHPMFVVAGRPGREEWWLAGRPKSDLQLDRVERPYRGFERWNCETQVWECTSPWYPRDFLAASIRQVEDTLCKST